jgi:hypothetical protein
MVGTVKKADAREASIATSLSLKHNISAPHVQHLCRKTITLRGVWCGGSAVRDRPDAVGLCGSNKHVSVW